METYRWMSLKSVSQLFRCVHHGPITHLQIFLWCLIYEIFFSRVLSKLGILWFKAMGIYCDLEMLLFIKDRTCEKAVEYHDDVIR